MTRWLRIGPSYACVWARMAKPNVMDRIVKGKSKKQKPQSSGSHFEPSFIACSFSFCPSLLCLQELQTCVTNMQDLITFLGIMKRSFVFGLMVWSFWLLPILWAPNHEAKAAHHPLPLLSVRKKKFKCSSCIYVELIHVEIHNDQNKLIKNCNHVKLVHM